MSTVIVLQHVVCETLGAIADALEGNGLSPRYVRTFDGHSVPTNVRDAVGLIVMGGPMGVYEHSRFPFLMDEMHLIEHALHLEMPVLGICLGSQLLASALGATVRKGPRKEIGWHPIHLSEHAASDTLWRGVAPSFVAYHWHGDIFDLPEGAISLASSDLTACQAFRYGRNAYGFLFHMEVTGAIISEMVSTFAAELEEARVDGQEIIERAHDHLPLLQETGAPVFRRWASLAR